MTVSNPLRGGMDPPHGAPGDPVSADSDSVELIMVEPTPLGVRRALAEMRARFAPATPGPDMLGMAETVLAEVLNNVVEHAYRHGGEGPIELRMVHCGTRLQFDVRDHGEAMPGDTLPGGVLPVSDGPDEPPPEGGFGWFLIRALARDLSYTRENGQNRLRFHVLLAEA